MCCCRDSDTLTGPGCAGAAGVRTASGPVKWSSGHIDGADDADDADTCQASDSHDSDNLNPFFDDSVSDGDSDDSDDAGVRFRRLG